MGTQIVGEDRADRCPAKTLSDEPTATESCLSCSGSTTGCWFVIVHVFRG